MAILPEEVNNLMEPRSNQPFSIHAPGAVWIVRSGKLDLFMVETSNGEPAGARHHVLRVEEGQAVFGMELIPQIETAIVATATPGTQLLYLPQAGFRDLAHRPTPEASADPIGLLEEWIENLGRAVSTAAPPKFFIELQAGEVLDVGGEQKPVMPTKGILWIEHSQGTSKFQNNPAIDPIGRPGYFPVSGHGWVQPQPGSRIISLATQEWQEADPAWQGLHLFHKIILQCLIVRGRLGEGNERKRLLDQAQVNTNIVGEALSLLASPLGRNGSPSFSGDLGSTDPVLSACEAVGKSLGVKIVAPPEIQTSVELQDLVASIARASTLRHRVVALKGKWWNQANGPMVAFRDDDNHPLALLPGKNRGYDVYDPVERTSTPVNAAVALTLNGFAYAFYRPLPNRELSVSDLFTFGLRGAKPELVTIVAMGIAGGLLGMVYPVATGIIFDTVIPGAQRTQLLEICGFLVFSALAAAMFTFTRSLAMLRLEGKMGASLQAAVWDRLLRLPVPFFRRYTSGDLADRSLGIEYVLRMLTATALSSILSGVFSIFSFLLLFYYNAQLALLATGLVVVAFAVSAVGTYFQVRYQRGIFRIRGHVSGIVLEFIDNIARLRVSGAEPRAFAVWAREFAAQKQLSISAQGVENGLTVFNAAFPVISLAVIFGYAEHLMGEPSSRAFTTGMFLAFLAAFIQFQSAALYFSSTVQSVLGVVPLYERIEPILKATPEVKDANKYPGDLTGSLELNHLNFRYRPDMPMVLSDFSLAVKAGEFVAVVGPSGSGKSTLLRLLLGFEKPESGRIYYDGQDLAGLDIQAVRKQLGVVIQNARLGSGTIFSNIAGSAPLTQEDAWAAAAQAGLDRDIREMPMGMHTIVSEGGGNLSGGQRQRLLIARAMVKKPRIFLFDEATSALDNQTQAIVGHSLDAFQATRIVIAHRLSTITNADRIVVIEKGVLVQSGVYSDLVNQEGIFRQLAKRQLT
jgi:ATP-binding cassette subfamily C protein